jgi:hypothetical protein
MNRRSFLSLFAGAAAASTVSYFLPPIGGWKSDVIAQPEYPISLFDERGEWVGQVERGLSREDEIKLLDLIKNYKFVWARDRLLIMTATGAKLRYLTTGA